MEISEESTFVRSSCNERGKGAQGRQEGRESHRVMTWRKIKTQRHCPTGQSEGRMSERS